MRTATNLPRRVDAFVGRAHELAALEQAIADSQPVVTLTGPGGVGKTRLARELGLRLCAAADPPAGGVWLCDLTEAHTLEELIGSVTKVLGVDLGSPAGVDLGARLAEVLVGWPDTVIILDNFDHLVPHAAVVARWVQEAPSLQVVITSRQALGLKEERRIALGGLLAEDARELFVHRARAVVHAEISLDDDVARLLARLDCVPLAIELAAARAAVLSPHELLGRLSGSFEVLDATPPRADARHATLERTLRWSWDMLAPLEQSALAQCSVFRGGFSLEAAEAILDLSPWPAARAADVLQSLYDRSLLCVGTAQHARRFTLFETIRDFAAARLAERGDTAATAQRHARHYLARSDAATEQLYGARGEAAIDQLGLESDNLLAAHRALLDSAPEDAIRALLNLTPAPILLSGGAEALHLDALHAAVARITSGQLDRRLAARALCLRGSALAILNRFAEARADLAAAIACAVEVGDAKTAINCWCVLGEIERYSGRPEEALKSFSRALEAAEHGEGPVLQSFTRGMTALCTWELGRAAEAQESLRRALAELPGDAPIPMRALLLAHLGIQLLSAGHTAEARGWLEQANALLGNGRRAFWGGLAVTGLAAARWIEGRADEAATLLREGLELTRRLGDRWLIIISTSLHAAVEASAGQVEEARAIMSRARAVAATVGSKALLTGVTAVESIIDFASARHAAGEGDRARAERHLEAGQTRLAEVMGLAMEIPGTSAGDSPYVRICTEVLQREMQAALEALGALSGAPQAPPRSPARRLRIGKDARWFAVDAGDPISLTRRRSLRPLLLRLVAQHRAAAGRALTLDEVQEAGWPGEPLHPHVAASRIYVAISTLRKLGLGDLLITRDDGYLIAPDTVLSVEDALE